VVAFQSGCRKGEILNMKWSDVDWKQRFIRLPKTKNGQKRNLPFWGSIEATLKAQMQNTLGESAAGTHTTRHVSTCFSGWPKIAGLPWEGDSRIAHWKLPGQLGYRHIRM
jgi:integrase